MTKKPLAVGDKVKVYGGISNCLGQGPRRGTVSSLEEKTIEVHFDKPVRMVDKTMFVRLSVHPKQCRRLKAKPRPQLEGKERVERWIVFCLSDGVVSGHRDKSAAEIIAERKGARVIRMTEVRPGEVLTDRRRLAEAWDAKFEVKHDHRTSGFRLFCQALGVP